MKPGHDDSIHVGTFDQDALGGEEGLSETPSLHNGTVGWFGDATHFDIGTEDNDGVCLVKVTLVAGHPRGEPRSPDGRANGHRILAQLSMPEWRIPKPGERCMVAFANGMDDSPGAGIIIAYPGKNPIRQFAEDRAMLDYRGYDLTIKAKSVSVVCEDGDQKCGTTYSAQGGAQLVDETGSGLFVKGGEVTLKVIDSAATSWARCRSHSQR